MPSDGLAASFASADANAFLEILDEDLAVAHFAAAVLGGADDGVHGDVLEGVVAGDGDLNLGNEVGHDLLAIHKKRTSQTGLRATTVSMKGMDTLFHCQPCQKPPSHRVTKKPRPPIISIQ